MQMRQMTLYLFYNAREGDLGQILIVLRRLKLARGLKELISKVERIF